MPNKRVGTSHLGLEHDIFSSICGISFFHFYQTNMTVSFLFPGVLLTVFLAKIITECHQ